MAFPSGDLGQRGVGAAFEYISGLKQIISEPRRLSAYFQADQFLSCRWWMAAQIPARLSLTKTYARPTAAGRPHTAWILTRLTAHCHRADVEPFGVARARDARPDFIGNGVRADPMRRPKPRPPPRLYAVSGPS